MKPEHTEAIHCSSFKNTDKRKQNIYKEHYYCITFYRVDKQTLVPSYRQEA